ncbi:hypothetical protein [Reinekea sp. G2M2-21]|uniref:hypothetical protein n=1 Tax=Reinekea sp. G2M2-21 TaxID=2788942 RepID=UPI0018ABA410|nr:hypothetical protein [Reinekea sp. G2M2-21]
MLNYRSICELAETGDKHSLLNEAGIVVDQKFWQDVVSRNPVLAETSVFVRKATNPQDASRPILKSVIGNLPYNLATQGINKKSKDLAQNEGKTIALPDQMWEIFSAIANYADDATILPAIRTKAGRVPCRNKRALITNVATIILSETCFYTNLVARPDKNGAYIDWAKEALAKKAGFTYIDDKGRERIEPSWLDSWDMFAAAYLTSAQSTSMVRHRGNRKGWARSVKAVKNTFFIHLCGSGAMEPQRLESLRKYAKSKFMQKFEDETIFNKTKSDHELSMVELAETEDVEKLSKTVKNVQKRREELLNSLHDAGFTLFTAAKLAWAHIPLAFSLTKIVSLSPPPTYT